MLGLDKFKKYKTIMVSVIIFILLDISVLAFSFYITYQISQDAVEINLAGRQRTLSQRITKNLLEFERAYHKSRPYGAIIRDIEESMHLFDNTLSAFDVGGDVVINDRVISVLPINNAAGRRAIETAKPMWVIYKNYTADVLNEFKGRESIGEDLVTIFFRESIVKDVVIYTTHNNIALLDVMNELTAAVEYVADSKTKKLRNFQATAIVLAVVNFFFILFFSLRRLRKSDEELDFARTEMSVMLDTISEGVFLLDPSLKISRYYSKEMEFIFKNKQLKGESLAAVLNDVCDDFNYEGVSNFLYALFDKTKNINVLSTLNPLQEILVNVKGDDKYLRFSYARIEGDVGVERVLVRVVDVSENVLQEAALHDERSRQFKHLRLVAALMNSNADVLPLFFKSAFAGLNQIGQRLNDNKTNGRADLSAVEILLGNFYREAELMGLDALMELVRNFQAQLKRYGQEKTVSDKNHACLLMSFNGLVAYVESMNELSGGVLSANLLNSNDDSEVSQVSGWLHLNEFASEVALKAHKEVDVMTSGLNDYVLSKAFLRLLNSLILQVFYHSITVSLEFPEDRHYLRKSKAGLLDVRLAKKANSGYYLTIKNDGAGLDVEQLKSIVNVKQSASPGKKELCAALLHACDPDINKPLSYSGDLLFGDELAALVSSAGVRFDVRSVKNEGGVFEFVLPSQLD
jgi:hypothetical protein